MEAAGSGDAAGLMIAVKAPIEDLMSLTRNASFPITLANLNSPFQGVLSGSPDAIARAEALCLEKGFSSVRLPVAAAFHSPLVQDAAGPFSAFLESIDIRPSKIPVIANVTGKPYPDDPQAVKTLLGQQITHPVQFLDAIEHLYEIGRPHFYRSRTPADSHRTCPIDPEESPGNSDRHGCILRERTPPGSIWQKSCAGWRQRDIRSGCLAGKRGNPTLPSENP